MKKTLCILMTSILLLGFVGCKSDNSSASKKYEASKTGTIETQSIAKNENIELLWEDSVKAVQIKNLVTGKLWSNIPYEYYLSGGTSAKVNSTINITVSKNDNLAVELVRGYDAVTNVECIKIENGIKVTYFFDGYQISVPVQYVLNDDCVEMSIDVNNITEGEGYKIVAVDIDPYICSVNNEVQDSYLFVPVGSGALMYPTEDVDKTRNFTGEVYGLDATAIVEEYLDDETPIRLPVFGVKDGNNALFCIIDEGDGAAKLSAEAGNSRTGYSTVYATFGIRGYDTFPITTTTAYLGGTQYSIYSDNIIEYSPKVKYYPLANENASYIGMAKCYRDFLKNNNGLSTNLSNQPTFDLNIVGGTEITTTTLGIPHSETKVLTSFKSAQDIIARLSTVSNMKPVVRLTGYGNAGIIPGKIAGGYKLSSIYGSGKERESLNKYCVDNGISLLYDFDLIRFTSSGKGFTKLFDSAITASLRTAENSYSAVPTRELGVVKYNLLKRSKINKAATLLDEFSTKNDINGISLLTFGELAYSDYSDSRHEVKGGLKSQANDIFKLLSKENRITASGPNLYAAVYSSSVNNVPTDNGGYFVFSESIPFYQMVFRGTKPLYANSANQVENIDKYLVDCISSGTSFSFALIENYIPRLSEKDNNYFGVGATKLFALKYDNNKDLINDILLKYGEIYSQIGNSYIEDYIIVSEGITKTVFSNGFEIYANHTNESFESEVGIIDAYGIKTVSK